MGDEERGLVFLREYLREVLLQHHLGLRIERRERLVEQQHLGVECHGARERRALAHAAGELVRVMAGEVAEVVTLEQRVAAAQALLALDTLDLLAQLDVLDDAAPGQQQVLLQHEGDVQARSRDLRAVEQHRAALGAGEAGGEIEQRALAATARADDGNHLAVRHRERHVADRHQRRALSAARRVFHRHSHELEAAGAGHGCARQRCIGGPHQPSAASFCRSVLRSTFPTVVRGSSPTR